MKTKQSQEGVILIDHRNSPGISREWAAANKISGPIVGAGEVYESALIVCHVCGGDVILNPNRSRDRAWCRVHDAYSCDKCAAAVRAKGKCVSLKQLMAEAYDNIVHGKPVTFPSLKGN